MKSIKYDNQLPEKLQFPYNIDSLLYLDPNAYPQLKDVINNLQQLSTLKCMKN